MSQSNKASQARVQVWRGRSAEMVD